MLDAWTAGIETPHAFNEKKPVDDSVVPRVITPQEQLFDVIKKEEDKKRQAVEEARQAEAQKITVEEEKKQKKAAEAAKAKAQEQDWEMPKDIDEEIKDLYSDSTTKKSSSA